VLYASKNGWNESIRYLAWEDNSYIRYFQGHRDQVVSLTLSPVEEAFLSASLDHTMRFWDLRSSACQGMIRRSGRLTATYDPQGIVVGLASGINILSLYDTRNYDAGPFSQYQIDLPPFEWRYIEFSSDGNAILLLTHDGCILVIDAFTGRMIQQIKIEKDRASSVCFSPDGQFIIAGSDSGRIVTFETESGKEIGTLEGHHQRVSAVRWNPKMMMIASADTTLGFWIPRSKDSS
jgi:COMPASS component SWD2